jgi:hypothetical protein
VAAFAALRRLSVANASCVDTIPTERRPEHDIARNLIATGKGNLEASRMHPECALQDASLTQIRRPIATRASRMQGKDCARAKSRDVVLAISDSAARFRSRLLTMIRIRIIMGMVLRFRACCKCLMTTGPADKK